jgi:hypothetical protein
MAPLWSTTAAAGEALWPAAGAAPATGTGPIAVTSDDPGSFS